MKRGKATLTFASMRILAASSLLALLLPAGCANRSPGSGNDLGLPGSTSDLGANADSGANADLSMTADFASVGAADLALADAGPHWPLPALPLHTNGRWIVDANGKRFKLASVNWYGAEEKDYVVAGLDLQPLDSICALIRELGFNSVRLPWSNEMFELNPIVADAKVAANAQLEGMHALDVFDAVIAHLAQQGLVVIIDNHTSNADWCCGDNDGNGLWYNNAYPEASWLSDWRAMVMRYIGQPAVVGVDLRNELRQGATWGGNPATDWHAAAERGGNAVLGANPSLLVIVEGINYANDLHGAYSQPVSLAVANRLVYSAHDYSWDHPNLQSYGDLKTALGNAWGYVLTQNQSYTAPLWVGEFGTEHSDASVGSLWFTGIRQYLTDADIDWSYWAINGTQATGTGRTFGAEETFGVLDRTWTMSALPALTAGLQALQPATQGP
jgi:endoglucanase